MASEATPEAIRTLDALDPEGRELFAEAEGRLSDGDGWGEPIMAERIANGVPEPVAYTYRGLVSLAQELMDGWDGTAPGHTNDDCSLGACPECNDYDVDAVHFHLLMDLSARRLRWLSGN